MIPIAAFSRFRALAIQFLHILPSIDNTNDDVNCIFFHNKNILILTIAITVMIIITTAITIVTITMVTIITMMMIMITIMILLVMMMTIITMVKHGILI